MHLCINKNKMVICLLFSLSFQKCGWLAACEAIFVYSSRNSRIFTYGIQTRGGVAFRFALQSCALLLFSHSSLLFFRFVFLWWFVLLHCFCLHSAKAAEKAATTTTTHKTQDKNTLKRIKRGTYRSHELWDTLRARENERNVYALSLDWLHSPNTHL